MGKLTRIRSASLRMEMALTGPHSRPPKARSLPWPAILALILAALVPLATFGSHAEGTHSGRAIAVQADASVADAVVVDITACDTGPLPEAGQPTQDCEVLNA